MERSYMCFAFHCKPWKILFLKEDSFVVAFLFSWMPVGEFYSVLPFHFISFPPSSFITWIPPAPSRHSVGWLQQSLFLRQCYTWCHLLVQCFMDAQLQLQARSLVNHQRKMKKSLENFQSHFQNKTRPFTSNSGEKSWRGIFQNHPYLVYPYANLELALAAHCKVCE